MTRFANPMKISLNSKLKEGCENDGSHWESNTGSLTLAASALTIEL